jgi:hypothetical protein
MSLVINKVFRQAFSTPSRKEQFDFLVHCYFGQGSDPVRLCINRAYLDFNRTLHGLANHKGASKLHKRAPSFEA